MVAPQTREEYQIAETLYYQWRERLLDGGKQALRTPGRGRLSRTSWIGSSAGSVSSSGRLAARLMSWSGGGTLAGLGVRVRVARSRALVAAGYQPAVVARVAGISRQALYRRPGRRRPPAAGPGATSPGNQVIVEVAKANPTDGTRMVAALASRQLGRPVNRKRVQRVMRAHRLLQRSRSGDRRRRPGFFRVTRPDELWHLDMTKVWTAQHGWVYLHAIIDCCTRELVGWSLELRCRDDEAIACVEGAVLARDVGAGALTLGTDNGSQFTSRDFRRHLSAPRDHPPARWLPRSRVPGVHRVLVRAVQETPGLALGVGVAGPGEQGDQRLHRRLPASAPFWPTAPQPRSPPAGGPTLTCYKRQRPDPSTAAGSTSRCALFCS